MMTNRLKLVTEGTPGLPARRQRSPRGLLAPPPLLFPGLRDEEAAGVPIIRSRKRAGAYYTPDPVARWLVQWAVRSDRERMLDPSCGDGRFIRLHRNSVGIEQDPRAAAAATTAAPSASVHEGDFFSWADRAGERFDCAAGNPPFIRYQTFKGAIREHATGLCARLGARFSGLASSWPLFLVATASLLRRGGRMAFVVPAEIGHAPYAAPLLDYLVGRFAVVHIIAVRKKLFPELSEDCWLLYAEGCGSSTEEIRFTALDALEPGRQPPRNFQSVSVKEWRTLWKRRLRPYLLPEGARDLYRQVADHPMSRRLGDLASVGIGYVSGANDFFHMRPSQAERFEIPKRLLQPTVRSGRALPARNLTRADVGKWVMDDDPVYLLRLPKAANVPGAVKRYLETSEGQAAREAYKCRVRSPWYSVPDVQVPDFFLTYMSGRTVNLVRNLASCTCTNSVHSVRLRDKSEIATLQSLWDSPFVRLSCEIEGHPLGGGLLKLEPREAAQIALPPSTLLEHLPGSAIEDAVITLQTWRHYAAEV